MQQISRASPNLVGIDACKAGWVVATSEQDFSRLQFQIIVELRNVFDDARRGRAYVIIDIPIGLADRNARQCDIEARRVLSRRHKSSVFPAPLRRTLSAETYAHACQLSLGACEKSLSRQAYGILPKIKEVDDLIDPALQTRHVREAHPEVVFACLAGHPLQHSKKSADGKRERLEILSRVGVHFDVEQERQQLGRGNVSEDDIIDATACLVTAHASWRNTLRLFPAVPCHDSRGLRMEIVAPSR
jgi:predicted RNase H-like nuclease